MREREKNLTKSIKWRVASIVASVSALGGALAIKEATKSYIDQPPINQAVSRTYEPEHEEEIKFFAMEAKQFQTEENNLPATDERNEVIEKVQINADIFGKDRLEQYTEDLQIYYPIYKVAADRFNLSWYLVWIVHEQESTASRDEKAFLPGRTHYGAMQRAKKYHPDEIVDKIAQDLALLAFLPQRRSDDWKEIVWAAAKLDEDRRKFGSLEAALYRYSAPGPAAFRLQQYLKYSQIFGQ